MPMNSGQSDFLSRMKSSTNEAVIKAAEDPPDMGGISSMPPGIKDGVARLRECGFYKYKPGSNAKMAGGKSAVGEYYFKATIVALEPPDVEINGRKVKVPGKQYSVMVNCFDTEYETEKEKNITTQEDNMTKVENYLKIFGASKESLKEGVENFEAIAEALQDKDNPVYLEFSTWIGNKTERFPNPKVQVNWGSRRADYVEGDASSNGFVDQSGEAQGETTQESVPEPEQSPESQDESAMPSEEELDKLAEAADIQAATPAKKRAATTLNDLAIKLGIDKAAVNDAADYATLVAMIKEASSSPDESTQEEPINVPKVEEVYSYVRVSKDGSPLKDPKGKQLKPINVTVKKVNTKDGTCDLISNIDKKPISGVPFDKLLTPS